MTRGAVLGGGGIAGVAWEAGIVIGLRRAGVDLSSADVIVGTSAGSIVGSHVAFGTDLQALAASSVTNKLQIGSKITHGLGAGSDPGVGRQAALEDTDKILEILEGTDMVFVTAGLGGGTGSGSVGSSRWADLRGVGFSWWGRRGV